jgi:hypothetical protein
MATLIDIFRNSQVVSTGCWIWCGPLVNGFGYVIVDGTNRMATREVLTLLHGPISPDIRIRKSCKEKLCINPNHFIVRGQPIHVELTPEQLRQRQEIYFGAELSLPKKDPHADYRRWKFDNWVRGQRGRIETLMKEMEEEFRDESHDEYIYQEIQNIRRSLAKPYSPGEWS